LSGALGGRLLDGGRPVSVEVSPADEGDSRDDRTDGGHRQAAKGPAHERETRFRL
jgi:hypothetical protein